MNDSGAKRIELLDTTLRDGAQAEGVSFSVHDKLAVVSVLDSLGIPLVEAGNPGSNPKDGEFFAEAEKGAARQAKLVAFGPTCHPGVAPSEDPQLQSLAAAGTGTVTVSARPGACTSAKCCARRTMKTSA